MSAPAIEIAGLTKVFRLYPDLVRSRIKQSVLFWNTYYREKVALRDVSLTIGKGEVVGVVGPNGAGKTTLLKIIAGISRPTSGTVAVRGRAVAVLALGLGFHPRLTGADNIELAGMMLGMTRAEVRRRRDWIADFSELGDYLAQPLTAYSSGMRARLSFAVAACQEPEILIIDEALATGDVRFVQKCIDRIREITRSGTTALFVSHNIWSIKRLTERCILVDQGRIVDDGDTGRVTDRYHEVMLRQERFEGRDAAPALDEFVGTGRVRLRSIELRDEHGAQASLVDSGRPAHFDLVLEAPRDIRDVAVSIACRRSDGIPATALGSVAGGALNGKLDFEHARADLAAGETRLRVTCDPLLLAPGDYSLDLALFDFRDHSGITSAAQHYFKPRVLEFGVRRLGNPNRAIVYYQPATLTFGAREAADAG